MKKILFIIAFVSCAAVTSTFAQALRVEENLQTNTAPTELKAAPAKPASCCSKKSSTDKSCAGNEKSAVKSCSKDEKAAGKSSCCQKGGHADAKMEEKTEMNHKN